MIIALRLFHSIITWQSTCVTYTIYHRTNYYASLQNLMLAYITVQPYKHAVHKCTNVQLTKHKVLEKIVWE